MSMTPRENFIHFLKGEPTEWTPTSGDKLEFAPAFIADHVARGLVFQQEPFSEEDYGGLDLFGVEWKYIPEQHGSMDIHPLLGDLDEINNWKEKVVFPDYSKMDWEGCAKANKDYLTTDKIICSTLYSGFFERLLSFIGFENAAMAFLDEDYSDSVTELFDALADNYVEYLGYLNRYFNVEYVLFHDDWGTQRSPIFSKGVYEDFIMPVLKKLAAGAHKAGVFIEIHSCGVIEPFVPLMAQTGVDTWMGQPVNDKDKLIEECGDVFKFGVEFAPPFFDDSHMEELITMAAEAKKKYAGKNIWLALPWELSPEGKDKLGALMKAM